MNKSLQAEHPIVTSTASTVSSRQQQSVIRPDGYPIVGRIESKLLKGVDSGTIPFPFPIQPIHSSSNTATTNNNNQYQNTPTEASSVSNNKLYSICIKIQSLIQPLISELLSTAANPSNSNGAHINSSRMQPVINTGHRPHSTTSGLPTPHPVSAAVVSKASPRTASGPTSASPRGAVKLHRNVRLVYNNTVNRAVKSNIYKGGFEVGLLWPQMLPSSSHISSSSSIGSIRSEVPSLSSPTSSGKYSQAPLQVKSLPSRVPQLSVISQTSLTSSATSMSPFLHNELPRWLIRQLKTQYAIPPSFLAGQLN